MLRRALAVAAAAALVPLVGTALTHAPASAAVAALAYGPGNNCAYRPGQVVTATTLTGPQLSAVNRRLVRSGLGTLTRTPDATVGGDNQATLYALSSGDPLHAADIVSSMGYEAQPNFAVGFTPNWAYSPGSPATPAPGYVGTPVRNAPSPTTIIGVVDTGFSSKGWPAGWPRAVSVFGPTGEVTTGPVGGHGTYIASLITQIAPNANIAVSRPARLDMQTDPKTGLDYPVIDDFGVGTAIDGLNLKAKAGVISLSLGTYACSDVANLVTGAARTSGPIATRQAVLYFHRLDPTHVVVAAAGNDAHGPGQPQMYPAAFSTTSGFTGGSLGSVSDWLVSAGTNASFSNYGASVIVSATGVDTVGFRPQVDKQAAGAYFWSGTSFATPCVAATLAAQQANIGIPMIETWLSTARSIGARPGRFSSGIANAPIDMACAVKF
jgi:hypothetical protein